MPGSWPAGEFPYLSNATCQVTSPPTPTYNCIAWSAKEDWRWWWPDHFGIGYWPPPPVSREETMQAFVEAFESLGYRLCPNGSLEVGLEKIAIFGKKNAEPDGPAAIPTHAALQLNSGEWTSKLGAFEDIAHTTVEAVTGPTYGRPMIFMARPRPTIPQS